MIDRRAFLATVSMGLVVTPLVGEAQQAVRMWRIAVLTVNPRPAPDVPHHYNSFVEGLRDLGYREGENIIIEWRSFHSLHERRIVEVAALMQWKPDVIVVPGGVDALYVRDVTKDVPIVVQNGGDLVLAGLAATVARPGGRVTGLQTLTQESMGKRLQLLRELVPTLARVGVPFEAPKTTESVRWQDAVFVELEAAARPLSVQVLRFTTAKADDLDRLFIEMKERAVQALIVPLSAFMLANADRIARLTLRHRLPDVHEIPANVEAGGLMSYGHNLKEVFRRSARFVDRILKGAKPGDLPIEQPTQFDLVISLRTAKTLGLTIPQSMLVRADRVIE